MSKQLLVFCFFVFFTEYAVSEKPEPVLQDPTRPIGYSNKGVSESLRLQAIFFGGGRKEAIINGRAIQEGDSVSGRKVVAIKKDHVIYESRGAYTVLKLRQSIFEK